VKALTFLRSLGASQPSVAHRQLDPARTRVNTNVSLDGRHRVVIVGCGSAVWFAARPAKASASLPQAGQVALKDRVNAIALAPVEDFRRDSDLFGEEVRKPEAQSRIGAAIARGFQTRDAELAFSADVGQLG
jgi:hypothetical protein